MSRWKSGRRRRTQIDGQFAARLIQMLESTPYRQLSLSARRVLDRLEIELAHHGGMDNGRLPVTFDDFQRYGIDRHAIAPAIRELVALGFIEVTEHGRAGNADWRSPNRFRITYKATKDADPTHEWKRIQTAEQARAKAREAREPVAARSNTARSKNKSPVGKNTDHSEGTPHLPPVRESLTTGTGDKTHTTINISGWGLGRRSSPRRMRQRLIETSERRRVRPRQIEAGEQEPGFENSEIKNQK
jgi:hypothetical protein